MKKILPLLLLVIVAFCVWFVIFRKKDNPSRPHKDKPLAMSQYSAAFNGSLSNVLKYYYALSEAFVAWDSAAIRSHTASLQKGLQDIRFGEIQKDSLIHQTAISYKEGLSSDLDGIQSARDITAKRQSFHSFSQNFYDLLRTVKYDGNKVYLQECPMAFNDTETGIWLSTNRAIRNPYLGTSHPKYKGGMLECGETKDSLTFLRLQNKI